MGEQFGEYEIEGRIGAGGMAEVYVATKRGVEGFKKRVCLKRVLTGDERDGDLVRHFQDEARLAAHLHHPMIAAVHDLDSVDGKWFMAMELVEGIDLRALVTSLKARGEPVPLEIVLLVARDVATALAYAHGVVIDGKPAGIVHRDITPSNVLLSIHGEVKLADFGIAKAATRIHRTRTGVVKGKIPYMAPEQALGDALDARTDLFALGVTLYELCAGKRPHDGPSDLDTLTNAQKGRRDPLSKLAPHVPFELVSLIDRLLSPKAAGRPRDAHAVLDSLQALPPSSDARRVLAELVIAARDPRRRAPERRVTESAPETRARGAVRRDESTDAPTMVGAPVFEPETRGSLGAAPRTSASQRIVQFAIGFGVVFTLGALVIGSLMLVVAGDRITDLALGAPSPVVAAPIVAAPPPVDAEPKPPEAPPPPVAVAPVPPPAPEPAPRPHDRAERPPSEARHGSGRVSVVVVPYGEVELDGDEIGRAPIDVAASEGRHRIRVTSGEQHVERSVVVRAGRTARVVIDLMDGD